MHAFKNKEAFLIENVLLLQEVKNRNISHGILKFMSEGEDSYPKMDMAESPSPKALETRNMKDHKSMTLQKQQHVWQ